MYYLKETYGFSLTLPFKRRGHGAEASLNNVVLLNPFN